MWMDRVCPCSCRWTGLGLFHTNGWGWHCLRMGVHMDGRSLLSFMQMDGVGCLSRKWTGGVVVHTDGVCWSSSTGDVNGQVGHCSHKWMVWVVIHADGLC